MPDTQTLADAVGKNLFQTLGSWAVIIIVLGAVLFLIFKYYLIPKEINKKTEKIKSALAKEQFIHRLQFEKEFETYLKLWKKLFVLKEATEMLIPVMYYDEPGKNEEQTRKIRLKRVQKAYGDVQKEINYNKPFFAKDVYKNANNILSKSLRQALASKYPGRHGEEFLRRFEEAQRRTENIFKIVDEIDNSIRKRILNIGKAKLIE